MSALLIDVGNTRVKWAYAQGSGLTHGGAIAHGGARWCEALAAAWPGTAPTSIWIASVAAVDVNAALRAALAAMFAAVPVEVVRSAPMLGGVRNGYREPGRLGVDRLLALAGSQAAGLVPAIVVGVGTATTIDALAPGEHRGGLILPSAQAMQAAVVSGTQVRPEHPGRVVAFARSTEDALAAGAWIALAASVERSASALARELGSEPVIVLHGGAAAELLSHLERPALLREQLVLEGLAAVAADAVG